MPQDPAPMDQLRDEPLRFLETEQFQEMLSVYRKLKPLEQENPRKFRNQLNTCLLYTSCRQGGNFSATER